MTVYGAGGGGPRNEDDNLKSAATAKILDLICEGTIQGLVDGAKSIYLNKTPIQAADGTFNYKDVVWSFQPGSLQQPYVPDFGDTVEAETAVNVRVTKSNGPITRTVIDPNLNAIRVRLAIPALQESHRNGAVTGSRVSYKISLKTGAASFVNKVIETKSGKTSTQYEIEYKIPLETTGPWDVRVERTSDDSTSDRIVNALDWASIVEVIEQKLRYPNSAVIGLKFDAKQFTSLPDRAYEIKGLVIKIPNNATVRADGSLTYSGSWGGEFQVAWSANPAWIFYDLITNARYGCGLDPLQIDKWGLFVIGQYCDELVSNGYGGTEPRFLINTYIQERADAYEVINSLTSAFRAMTYWQAGLITAVQDAPGTPVRAFNQTNVKEGIFKYAGTAKRSRHTVAIIRWNDPQDFYQSKLEVVEYLSGLRQYGYNETSVVAFGCTSRGQAHRLGKWLLYTEREETETVSFTVGADGIPVRPGDLIKIGDAKRVGTRRYGRIKSASTTTVELDSPVTLSSGSNYMLGVMLPTNTFEERVIVTGSGQQSVISVSPAFSIAPATEAIWLLSAADTSEQIYRVISVSEQSGESATEYEITALIHKESKFAAVEQNLNFEEPPLPRQLGRSATSTPRQVSLTSSVQTQSDSSNFINLGASWLYPLYEGTRDVLIASYAVQYKLGPTGNWTGTGETSSQFFEWSGLSEGEYYVRVRAIDISGRPSAWIESTALSVYNKVLLLNSDEVLALDGGSSLLI